MKIIDYICLLYLVLHCKIEYNGSRLGEVAEIEAQMFGLALQFNRCTDVQLTIKTAILANTCYKK